MGELVDKWFKEIQVQASNGVEFRAAILWARHFLYWLPSFDARQYLQWAVNEWRYISGVLNGQLNSYEGEIWTLRQVLRIIIDEWPVVEHQNHARSIMFFANTSNPKINALADSWSDLVHRSLALKFEDNL